MPGPLDGIRVLDIATVIAAPFAATLLADYGAEVVKAELPGAGDPVRQFPPFKDGRSLWWKVTNRNKRFVTLDLGKPEGQALLLRMLPQFDVLIENFRPGTLDRWNLSRDTLWAANPRLTILRVTGFGQDGPYAHRPGFARLFEAMGGLAYLTGEADGPPLHPAYPIGDAIGGLFGALGVVTALCRRFRDGPVVAQGEEIDLSLTEATFRILDKVAIEYDQLGTSPQRIGSANPYSAPSEMFRTRDGHWVSLAGSTDRIFAANARAIGRADLAADPRFAGNRERIAHAAELNGIFATWIAEHELATVMDAFTVAGGTIAPVYSAEQIAADPQMRARDAIVTAPDEDFGEVRMQSVVPRFTRNPGTVTHAAGSLGRDNGAVYGALAGLDDAEIRVLADRGVI
jgi:crotonobetainyl-CoA:carnitine CoA-transferase CaiB-like acyl-CoA transferase